MAKRGIIRRLESYRSSANSGLVDGQCGAHEANNPNNIILNKFKYRIIRQ